MGNVDPAFIQELEHRPKLEVVEAQGIPQIDLSSFINSPDVNSAAIEDLVNQVHDACENWGFFQVINHGVPIEVREKLLSTAKKFFDQPAEEKTFGYYDTELTKDVRDWKEVFDFKVEVLKLTQESDDKLIIEHPNWPDHPPELRDVCEEYINQVEKLFFKLLELISLSLNLPANRFGDFFSDQTSVFRVNHYPPCPAPGLALGVGRHKDGSALTILAQDDVGGLEVKRRSDGEWTLVKPIPNSFIINVGDIMTAWTNGKYESAEHRAKVNSTKSRYSIPIFYLPSPSTMVEPLAELTDESNPAKYKSYNWGEALDNALRENFKKINKFKVDDVLSRVENVVI